MTNEIYNKSDEERLNEAKTMIDKIKILVIDMMQPDVAYNLVPGGKQKVEDIALIQCFYGTDSARIRATTTALDFMLKMTRLPSTWVFVECQKRKSDCAFGWLRAKGIKYVFVPMKDENDGIFLKTPLWNIGARSCSESRLCFVDSDVVIEESDWVEKAAKAFTDGKYDVMSLAQIQYNEDDEKCEIKDTIGYNCAAKNEFGKGHCGFTIGMTRKAFDKMNGFGSTLILDDIKTYYRIFGDRYFSNFSDWTEQFELDPIEKRFGYPFKIGYVPTVACHIWHENVPSKYDAITKLMKYAEAKTSDIIRPMTIVQKKGGKVEFNLPTWNTDDERALVIKKTIKTYMEKMSDLTNDEQVDIIDLYINEMQKTRGVPSESCFYVCTVVKNRFGLKYDDLIKFRNRIECKFVGLPYTPTIVFFTDFIVDRSIENKLDDSANPQLQDEDNLNIVSLNKYNVDKEWEQCLRKDLKFPNGSVIYYIPFDSTDFNVKIWIPTNIAEYKDGTILISR